MCNKYVSHLKAMVVFLSTSSNFSGKEETIETVNWSHDEINSLSLRIKNVELIDIKYFIYSYLWRLIKIIIIRPGELGILIAFRPVSSKALYQIITLAKAKFCAVTWMTTSMALSGNQNPAISDILSGAFEIDKEDEKPLTSM